jgi:hypothetical protein
MTTPQMGDGETRRATFDARATLLLRSSPQCSLAKGKWQPIQAATVILVVGGAQQKYVAQSDRTNDLHTSAFLVTRAIRVTHLIS